MNLVTIVLVLAAIALFVFIVRHNSVSDKSRSSTKSTTSPEVIFTNEDHTVLDAAVVDVNVNTELAL